MQASILILAALLVGPPAPPSPSDPPSDEGPFWADRPTASAFERRIDARLTEARAIRDRLLAVRGRRTIANTLTLYDQLRRQLEGADNQTGLIAAVHPDSGVRATAEAAAQRVAALGTEITLDRRIYDALTGMDTAGADAATRYYVRRTLLGFRLAGVDKDDAIAGAGACPQRGAGHDRTGIQPQHPRGHADRHRGLGGRPGGTARGLHRGAPARRGRTDRAHDRVSGRGSGVHLCPERRAPAADADRLRHPCVP